ncbi:unnamed protein product [Callosobruchus maculatus]|uniref:Uncharacterized protein n=1 Tax=Callosobruchus maculatus TaxID=64391 RepID=A0A653BUX0_CALMS|nr:unnamed protein product [Callosobruchus maculatus]
MEDKDTKRGPNYTQKKREINSKICMASELRHSGSSKKVSSSTILKLFSRSLICLGIPEIIKFTSTHSPSSCINKLFLNKSIFELCLANIEKKLKVFQFDVTLSKA